MTDETPTEVRPNVALKTLFGVGLSGLILGAIVWPLAAYTASTVDPLSDMAPWAWLDLSYTFLGVGTVFMFGYLVIAALRHKD